MRWPVAEIAEVGGFGVFAASPGGGDAGSGVRDAAVRDAMGLVLVLAVVLAGLVMLLALTVLRRWYRRRQEMAERREEPQTGVSAWSVAGQRAVGVDTAEDADDDRRG